MLSRLLQFYLFFIYLIAAVNDVAQDDDWTPIYNPTININSAPEEIKIDGYLNDPCWQGAAVANHFHENGLGDQIRPPVNTGGFITYDETHLYVSAVCYDNPDELRASLSQRDRLNGDNIRFQLGLLLYSHLAIIAFQLFIYWWGSRVVKGNRL